MKTKSSKLILAGLFADIMGEHLKSLQEEPPIKPGTPDPYVPAER